MNWYKEKRYISLPIEHWRSLQANATFQNSAKYIKFYNISEQNKSKQKYIIFKFTDLKPIKPRTVQPLSGTYIDNRLDNKSVLFEVMAPQKPNINLNIGNFKLLNKEYGYLMPNSFYLDERNNMQAIMNIFADKSIIITITNSVDFDSFSNFISSLTGISKESIQANLLKIQHQPEFSKAYLHYLGKSGNKRNYSYQTFLKSFPNIEKFYKEIVQEILTSIVDDLKNLGILYAKFQLSSSSIPISRWDFDRKPEHTNIDQSINSDWNFAIGDHFAWIGVDAIVSNGKAIANLRINAESMFIYGLEHFVPSTKESERFENAEQIFSMGASFNAGDKAAHPEHLTYSQISHQFARMGLAKPYIQVGTAKLEIR